jgi:hypothetical protein
MLRGFRIKPHPLPLIYSRISSALNSELIRIWAG